MVAGFVRGFLPASVLVGPGEVDNCIKAGEYAWVRTTGRVERFKGINSLSEATGSSSASQLIMPVNTQRGVLTTGNLIKYREALFAVGSGQMYLDGSSTDMTTATSALKVRVGTTWYTAGLAAPTAPTIAIGGAGGQTGSYSVKLAAKRTATQTVSNPSLASNVLTGLNNQAVNITFPAAASGQDAWLVYATSGGTGSTGPWKLVTEVSEATVAGYGGRANDFSWRDGELIDLAENNRDTPPSALGLGMLGGVLFLWGTFGGTCISPSLPDFPEAFPPDLTIITDPPETIIGVVAGEARAYVMTTNRLHVVSVGSSVQPLVMRPAWQGNFHHQNSAVFAGDTLYAAMGNTLVRSLGTDTEIPDQTFAAPVSTLIRDWTPANIRVGYDPVNSAVVYFHWDGTNTTALPFMLQTQIWSTPMTLPARVISCATVNGILYLLIQGSTLASPFSSSANNQTYQWDAVSGSPTWNPTAYVATPFNDCGFEGLDKMITGWQVTAKSNGTARLFINNSDVTNNSNAVGNPQALSNPSRETHEAYSKQNVKFARSLAMKVDFTNVDGTCSEVSVDGYISRVRR